MFKATNLSNKHGLLVRYAAALAAVGAGFLLRLGLTALAGAGLPTYITFYPVIMAVALFGGFGPGLLATLATALAVDYWILPPRGFGIASAVDALGLAFFSGMGFFMSVVAELYRRSRLKAAAYDKELALQESRRQNEFLASVVEHSAQAFGMGYPDGRLGLVNRAFEQLTGYTAEELRATNWAKTLTPPEWRELERQKLEELHLTGQPVRYEKEYLRKDGTRVPIELLVHLVRDAEGKTEYYYSFITDISERKRAEEALRESERQFRTLADSIPNLAWWANGDGYITWYNRRWYEYTGTTPRQMEGWGWQSVHDPQALPAVMERWKVSLASGEPFDMTFPLRGADGVFRPFLTRVIPLKDAQGRVQQWFGTNTDVSEQKQAEAAYARLAAIVESSDDAILAKDLAGTITSWNAGAERLFGYRPEEMIGRSIRLLLPQERQDEEDQVMARLLAGERVEQSETVRLAKDGRSVPVSVTVSPLKDGEGRMIGASKIVRDITERKRAEAAVHELNTSLWQRVAELQAANEEVQASRRAALSLAEDSFEARQEAERVNAELQKANEALDVSRHAALNLMDDAVRARKQAERSKEELQRLNRTLKAHSKSDQALVRARGESEYLAAVCQIVVEDCGHAMVWVGFAEEDEAKTVQPVAQAGFEEGYLETLRITWADTDRGRGPTGTAIRNGQPTLCRNVLTDPRFEPWRAEAVKRGYASSLVLPLLAEGRAFGALTIYSRQPDGFSDDEVRLLTALADDLAYGINVLRLHAAKERADVAQRQSEERYRGLVELSPEGLFVNRNNRIVLVNPAALKLFGAASAEQLLGKSPFEVFHPDYHAVMRERIGELLAGQSASALEEKIIRLDGVAVDVEVVAAPMTDHGEPAILVLLRDITERKRAEAALQQTAEELERSNRDLEQFAYVASHDLQEPLRAVGGYVKLLQHRFPETLDDKARDYIAGAFDGATRMERLITDLLAFSRVGTHGGSFVAADLGAVLDRALRNLQTAIETAHATVTHDPLPTLSVDATQIMQLFQNLIGNAVKFHGEEPLKIHVAAQEQDGRWVFSVRDNGIGMEPQYFERIFQVFQRLHTRKKYPGTGIGLAICKKIVERHGGTIWVESQPGQGSTFFFSIPDPKASRKIR